MQSSLRKFYCRHHDLVSRNGIFMSQMATGMFCLSSSQSGPFLIPDLPLGNTKGVISGAGTVSPSPPVLVGFVMLKL